MEKELLNYNLQLFAEEEGNVEGAADGEQTNQPEESKSVKTFTQDELDAAIKKRLAEERKKAQRKEQELEQNKGADNQQADKLTALEAKLLCYEHDVSKESVSDVVALAKSYVDEDTTFEEALEKVIKKYPQFVKGAKVSTKDEDGTNNKSWGQRQTGKNNHIDGVEEAFLRKNPGLKID